MPFDQSVTLPRNRGACWQAEAKALVRHCLHELDRVAVESAAKQIVGHLRTARASQR
jgi:hypothetical protein